MQTRQGSSCTQTVQSPLLKISLALFRIVFVCTPPAAPTDCPKDPIIACRDSIIKIKARQLRHVSDTVKGEAYVWELPPLACHNLLTLHRHAVWVGMILELLLLLEIAAQALRLRYRTFLVLNEYRFQLYDFLPHLGHLRIQRIVLTAEQLDLGL